jgi:hypothetical protein
MKPLRSYGPNSQSCRQFCLLQSTIKCPSGCKPCAWAVKPVLRSRWKGESDDYQLHFSGRDIGIGIAPDRMGLLFRSFSQLDASTTRKFGVTGLGFAISKGLAELMQGSMWVESESIPGRGSTFHFTIRARQSTSAMPVFLHVKQPELSGKRVLIVGDYATNRYILMRQV